MELTVENAVEIAEKYGFTYEEKMNEIVISHLIYIDDDDLIFLRFEYGSKGFEYSCAYEFGLIVHKNGKFGYRTVSLKKLQQQKNLKKTLKTFCPLLN